MTALVPLDTLFEISKGHQLALTRLKTTTMDDGVAYVARSHRNNGITAWVERITDLEPAPAGMISVALRSRNHALAAHVQPRVFYTSYHVAVLTPIEPMSLAVKLWYCRCIEANRFRFHFGRQANRTIASILLPAVPPAWLGDVEPQRRAGTEAQRHVHLATDRWHQWRLDALFDLSSGRFVKRRDLPPGDTPFVTATDSNNGVSAWVGVDPDWPGGQITVSNNGARVGAAFYQPRPFAASRDVTILNPKVDLSPAAALFVCVVIRADRFRWNYARKWTTTRMRASTIRLPARDGQVDLDLMERYVRGLSLGPLLDATDEPSRT